jgi:hypothetical protein
VVERAGMAVKKRYVEAFKENYNTVGLATAIALSAALLNPLPLLAAMVLEAGYLLFVPDSKWYEARLSQKYDQEVIDRRQKLKAQVFPGLNASIQARFTRMENLRNQVESYQIEGQQFFREVLRKMDYLLEKFLLFSTKQVQFHDYLKSVVNELDGTVSPPPVVAPDKSRKRVAFPLDEPDEGWVRNCVAHIQECYKNEIDSIDQATTQDENLHNQAVLEKRKEVLSRRAQYVSQIGDILTNLDHQLHLMEDTFGLINDEIRARSPEQVLADIEDVVAQTDTLTETLEDVSPFDQMPIPAGGGKLYDVPEEKA